MARYGLQSGLPDLPVGLADKDFSLVAPLYRGISSLAQQLSANVGQIQYEPGELAEVDQLVKLLDSNTRKITVQAGEALAYGNLLALSVAAGKIVAHKADATNLARPGLAVCDTVGGVAINGFCEAVFMQGRTAGISGSVLGAAYYLSTAGAVQLAPPVATGVINQIVGIGLGSAGFYLNIEPVGRRPVLVYKFNATTLRVLYTDGTFTDNAV